MHAGAHVLIMSKLGRIHVCLPDVVSALCSFVVSVVCNSALVCSKLMVASALTWLASAVALVVEFSSCTFFSSTGETVSGSDSGFATGSFGDASGGLVSGADVTIHSIHSVIKKNMHVDTTSHDVKTGPSTRANPYCAYQVPPAGARTLSQRCALLLFRLFAIQCWVVVNLW